MLAFDWDKNDIDIYQFFPSVNRTIDIFDCCNSFQGKNINVQVQFFNKTILNIFQKYIPNKTIVCSDNDPPWFDNEIRKIITKRNEKFEQYITNGKFQTDYERLQMICNCRKYRSPKERIYFQRSTKLANPSTSSKAYWLILKTSHR